MLCHNCYFQEINNEALTRIEDNFIPASIYNKKLFELYIAKIRNTFIDNCEIPVARKWAEVLTQEKIEPLDSWSEVLKLSDKYKIRHTSKKNQGCPVLRTARVLASNGELVSIKLDVDYRSNLIFNQLQEPLRTLAKSFWLEINVHHEKSIFSLKILRAIVRFYKFLPAKDAFWTSSIETAQNFLDQLPSKCVADYSNYLIDLKRFFDWGIVQNITTSNPFLGITPHRLIRVCGICNKEKILRNHNLFCNSCDVNRRYGAKIKEKNLVFTPKSPYNKEIYELYLKYINRFMLEPSHYRATVKLQNFLSETEVTPFQSWTDVTLLSRKFKEVYGQTRSGCPIEKIGRMLQELSILSIREEDLEIYLLQEISNWDVCNQELAKRYVKVLRKQRRTISTARQTLQIIRSFMEWLESEGGGASLFTAQELMARGYCEKFGVSTLETYAHALNKFFRWAIRVKLTFINPFAGIKTPRRVIQLQICDDQQIMQLEKFLKNKDSDPELALIMALVLYWGFTAKNLAWATLEISEFGQLKIILHRGELSCKNKQHNRKQVLLLPTGSKWFLDLQKRYAELWQSRYEKVKKDFSVRPLILHKRGLHNRPLWSLAILKRFTQATQLACGASIPLNIVRRTCGHLYSIQGDTGILTEMGWSTDYSLSFMWRPRRLFRPTKTKT